MNDSVYLYRNQDDFWRCVDNFRDFILRELRVKCVAKNCTEQQQPDQENTSSADAAVVRSSESLLDDDR